MPAKSKIIKLLNLTRSDNDAEALNAIRAANRLCEDWGEFFGTAVSQKSLNDLYKTKRSTKPPPSRASWVPQVSEMLQECLERCEPKVKGFVISLSEFYDRKKFLTPKQADALEKIYKNLK